MLRYYREEGKLKQWNKLSHTIDDNLEGISKDHLARFHYERCLSSLFELNLDAVRMELTNWNIDTSMPFWEAKKAGLFAEVGEISTAHEILENSLSIVRSKSNLKPITTDYSMASEEGIIMLLLDAVQRSRQFQSRDFTNFGTYPHHYIERWHTLRAFGCDPRDELRMFNSSVDRLPIDNPEVSEEASFDIHRRVRKRHFGRSNTNVLDAYRFLRFSEDSGIPFRIYGCSLSTHIAKRTLRRVSQSSPYWAMSTLVRIGDANVVDEIFDRRSLAGMSTELVDELVLRYLKSLDLATPTRQSRNQHHDTGFGGIVTKVLPEILSRLCCKCSDSVRSELYQFLLQAYQSDFRRDYSGIRNLTERLLSSYSARQRYKLIPELLDFPIRSTRIAIEDREFVNPLDLIEIDQDAIFGDVAPNSDKITALLHDASSTISAVRRWALNSLRILYRVKMLNPDQVTLYGIALWRYPADHDGFPSNTSIPRYEFLDLPHPNTVDPIELFKNYVLDLDIDGRSDPDVITFPTGIDSLCREIRGAPFDIAWSPIEATRLCRRLTSWWDSQKSRLKWNHRTGGFRAMLDELRLEVANVVDALRLMVMSAASPSDDIEIRSTLARVTNELKEFGVSAVRLDAACLNLFPERRESILIQIEDAMDSSSEDAVFDSLVAITVIATTSSDSGGERKWLSRVIRFAGEIVHWRRKIGLVHAMQAIGGIVSEHEWILAGEFEKSVLRGLGYLIKDTENGRMYERSIDSNVDRLVESTRLRERCAAARLAYRLAKVYAKRGITLPTAIKEWECICRSEDEFAEIRHQWIVLDRNE